jgi:protein TonB
VTETSTVEAPEAAPIVAPEPPDDSAPEIAPTNDPEMTKPIKSESTPEPEPLLALPPPKVEVPEASAIPIEKLDVLRSDKPATKPSDTIEQMRRKEQRQAKRRQAMRAARLATSRAHARQQAHELTQGAATVHAGVADGAENASQSLAAYGMLVSAELNRHKHYPPDALAAGVEGRVGLIVSIGPSGAILSHAITRSSGNAAIDASVRQMVAASHPPPPPGGSFRGSVVINFNLGR